MIQLLKLNEKLISAHNRTTHLTWGTQHSQAHTFQHLKKVIMSIETNQPPNVQAFFLGGLFVLLVVWGYNWVGNQAMVLNWQYDWWRGMHHHAVCNHVMWQVACHQCVASPCMCPWQLLAYCHNFVMATSEIDGSWMVDFLDYPTSFRIWNMWFVKNISQIQFEVISIFFLKFQSSYDYLYHFYVKILVLICWSSRSSNYINYWA